MNYSEIRRLLLRAFIGFLSLTALVAIFSLLSGEFGQTQGKVVATTFSISAGSICAMACAAFLERKGARGAGFTGILTASVAVLLVIPGVWGEITEGYYWKSTLIAIVVSVAFAHGCLLRLPKLAESYRWTQTGSTILIGLLAVQIMLAILGEFRGEGYYRSIGVVSVLLVLVTLIIPICSRLGQKADEGPEDLSQAAEEHDQAPEQLLLRRVSGAVFVDQGGLRYHVREMKAKPGAAPNAGSADAPPASVS